MIRISSPNRVVYWEHTWKLSLGFFLLALTIAGSSLVLPGNDRNDLGPMLVVYGAIFLLASLLLLSSRRIVIDHACGTLKLVERRPLSTTYRREFSIDAVRIRTSSADEDGARAHHIWLEIDGRKRVLFMGRLARREQVRDLVVQLTRDLEAPASVRP